MGIPRQSSIVLQNGQNDNVDLGNFDFLVITGPVMSYSISSFVARPDQPRVLLYVGSRNGTYCTILHDINLPPGVPKENRILCPQWKPMMVPCNNSIIEMFYDAYSQLWRPLAAMGVV